MNNKNRKILELIFKNPIAQNIRWIDIEALFKHIGAEITEGNGSRVRIVLNGIRSTFHRPHPKRETDKGAVIAVRKFLIHAGIIL